MKKEEEMKYGCFVDHGIGEPPQHDCVIENGEPSENCCHARKYGKKEDCPFWREIKEPWQVSPGDELKQQNAEMLELLKELEWAYGDDRYDNVCAVCDRLKTEGHAADCKLGNLLKRLES
jgi:hypothetical protein